MERVHHRRRLLHLPIPRRVRRSCVRHSLHACGAHIFAVHNCICSQIQFCCEDQCGVRVVSGGASGVPLMDVWYVKGRVGVYGGYYATVAVVGLCGVADGLVQGGVVGNAGSCLRDLKSLAVNEEKEQKGDITGKLWRSTLWDIVGTVKWYGSGILIIYVVALSIFPGSVTEDVHSDTLKDWYPIILIAGYNVFDLIGKSLTPLYLMENAKVAIGASFGRLLFLPIFYGCLHGPDFFKTEIPITILTCLLGLTNGYFTCVLMILAPKTVQLQHAETAGIVLVLYLVFGLAIGSVVSWFWVL
ncbi:hypothetical protein DH2020_027029 [Rehmannia glutinosa]|uniref:Uncharacterized protein n=1 Tax=Rehmannia glutinosa TaxID=99300 RepID=A0ABR0VX64_REHGL